MNSPVRRVPENISAYLHEVSPLPPSLHPELASLHSETLSLLRRDVGKGFDLRPGAEVISATSVNVDEYVVRLFASQERTEPFDEVVTTTGLRFLSRQDRTEIKVADIEFDDSTGALLLGEREQEKATNKKGGKQKGSAAGSLSEDIDFLKDTLGTFKNKIVKRDRKELAARKRRTLRRRRAIRRLGATAGSVVMLGAGALALEQVPWKQVHAGGIGRAVAHLFQNDVTHFDEHHYSLAGGDVGTVGQTIHPAFSTQLYGSSELGVNKVPRVDEVDDNGGHWGNHFPNAYAHPYDGHLKLTSGLRELIITTDERGQSCRSSEIESSGNLTMGTKVVAWTDFVESQGQSGASELYVKLEAASPPNNPPEIEACWYGHDPIHGVHPRVVFKLLP